MSYGNLVLVSSKTNFISKGIRWFTQSTISHAFLTMPDVLDIPMCMEAVIGGVDMSRFDTNYLNNPDEIVEIWELLVLDQIKIDALQKTINELEVGYGFLEYPWFVWRRLNSLFGRDIKSQNNWSTDGMICSQLCVSYLNACGVGHIFDGYGKGSIAPQDLSAIFNVHPELFKLTQSIRMPA